MISGVKPIITFFKNISFKLETGAQANVLFLNTFNAVKQEQALEKTKAVLTAFRKSKMHPLVTVVTVVTVVIPCQHQGRQWNIRFYATDRAATPILGQNACQKLGLIE